MSLSTHTVSVSASTTDPAPTATVTVSISPAIAAGTEIYIVGNNTSHGIASIAGAQSGAVFVVTITFDSPATLGAGTYDDTVTVNACMDQACTQPINGSPQTVTVTYTVTAVPLTVTTVSPATVTAGGPAFTLTVLGTGFLSTSVVQWNGSARPTTFVSATELTAQIAATDIAATGSVSVTVMNSGSATSNSASLTISAPSIDAVSYQMNAAHTGAVSFNSVTLPKASSWSVNVGGPPSYALIVGGRVFVTVGENGNSELLALDASTGATVWGPIAFAGYANATYDAGLLFVSSGSFNSQIISAIDPSTGASKWSSTVGGGWYPAPPVAAEGIVYAVNAGLVSAFNETSGATLWQQEVTGTSGTLALSVDGVYTSAPCTTYDLQPPTGSVIWTNNTGCEGGGGNTPVVANGVLYSPINGGYSGSVFDAETGKTLGSFAASTLPALTATNGFFLTNSTLQGLALSNNQILWSFAGDGALVTAPIVVNGYVFVGSSQGNLYAVDATTGAQVWTQNVGAAMQANGDGGLAMYTGLAAGDGLLVVPAGNTVTAYTLSTNP